MRACESCHGPGPVLHSDKDQRYLCVKCHENPSDEFFHKADPSEVTGEAIKGTILPMFEHYNWLRGIRDSMKIVEDRKRYLQSLGPAATPKPGVIEVLDEIMVQLKAMHDRGSFSYDE